MLKKYNLSSKSFVVISALIVTTLFFIWGNLGTKSINDGASLRLAEKAGSVDSAGSSSLMFSNNKGAEALALTPCLQFSPFGSENRPDCIAQTDKFLPIQEKNEVYIGTDTSTIKSALVGDVLNAVPGSGAASAKAYIQCTNIHQDTSADDLAQCDELRSNLGVILLVLKIQADKGDADAALYKARYYLSMLRNSTSDDKNRVVYQDEFERMSLIASVNHSAEISELKENLPK